MRRTREDLEAEVTRCEAELAKAQRELAAFDARPNGCQCDPHDWWCSQLPPICAKFEPDTDPQFSDLCRHCQHPAECHADRERMRTKRKLKNKCDVDFHGIAFGEISRTSKNKTGEIFRYPLVEWQITEKQALEYCYSKGLDWGGLYEKFHRVSCWCCPLSRIGELRVLYNDFPELWEELEEMDKKTFRKFRRDYSIAELREKFANENL